MARFIVIVSAIFLSVAKIAESQEGVGGINVGYASINPRSGALWIAKENRIFEKYGLDVKLVSIRGSATVMQALVGGDIDLVYVTGAAVIAAAARGMPVVIVAISGHNDYKLLAHQSITSLAQLRGKAIGISNLAGSDYFALRRMLPKLGLIPAKDVFFLTTGIHYPQKPYPSEQAILQAAEDLDAADPKLRAKQRGVSEFMDVSALRQIEKEGFFAPPQHP